MQSIRILLSTACCLLGIAVTSCSRNSPPAPPAKESDSSLIDVSKIRFASNPLPDGSNPVWNFSIEDKGQSVRIIHDQDNIAFLGAVFMLPTPWYKFVALDVPGGPDNRAPLDQFINGLSDIAIWNRSGPEDPLPAEVETPIVVLTSFLTKTGPHDSSSIYLLRASCELRDDDSDVVITPLAVDFVEHWNPKTAHEASPLARTCVERLAGAAMLLAKRKPGEPDIVDEAIARLMGKTKTEGSKEEQ